MLISVQLLGCPLSLDMRDLSPDHRLWRWHLADYHVQVYSPVSITKAERQVTTQHRFLSVDRI